MNLEHREKLEERETYLRGKVGILKRCINDKVRWGNLYPGIESMDEALADIEKERREIKSALQEPPSVPSREEETPNLRKIMMSKDWRPMGKIEDLEIGDLVRLKDYKGEHFTVNESGIEKAIATTTIDVTRPQDWELLSEPPELVTSVRMFLENILEEAIPAQANWIAQDEDGEWWWYQNKPRPTVGAWINEEGRKGYGQLMKTKRPADFRDTLRRLSRD